jgi:poly(3-hydroxybutyrate) depolymerase
MTSYRSIALLSLAVSASVGCGDSTPTPAPPGSSGSGGSAQPGGGGAAGASAGGNTSASGNPGSGGSAPSAGAAGSGGGTPNAGAPGGGSGGASGGSGGSGGASGGAGGASGGSGGASGGAGGAGGSAGGGGPLLPNNPAVKSAGCGKTTQVTSGEKMIMSDGRQRSYTIDLPAGYDKDTPHRFVLASHWIGSNDESVKGQNFYHLKPKAQAANVPVIFLAPQALPGTPNGTWSSTEDVDHAFFDDILAYVKENLCIDTTRVFAIGFSFGGMQTYSLSVNHQKDIRAAVGIAPANWNIYVPPKTGLPIAWMQTTGMGDTTCKWVNNDQRKEGAKYIALEHGADNGCTVPADVPTWQSGSYSCYDFAGCKPGYPTKACTFNGGHVSTDSQPWIAEEAWKFFMQF